MLVEWVPTRDSTQHTAVKVSMPVIPAMEKECLLFDVVFQLPGRSDVWEVLGVLRLSGHL